MLTAAAHRKPTMRKDTIPALIVLSILTIRPIWGIKSQAISTASMAYKWKTTLATGSELEVNSFWKILILTFRLEPVLSESRICTAAREELMPPRRPQDGQCAPVESQKEAQLAGCSASAIIPLISFLLLFACLM